MIRSFFAVFVITGGIIVLPLGGHAADDPPFTWAGIVFTPYLGVSAGYSTNPDEDPGGRDSPFLRYDGSLAAAVTEGKSEFTASLRGRLEEYPELDVPERWLYEANASIATELSATDSLVFDLRRRHDALDDTDEDISHRARASWSHEARHFELKTVLSFRNKDFLSPDEDNVFDYNALGGELTARWEPRKMLSPFFTVKAADVDYTNQAETRIDRDAMNYAALGGVRLTPVKSLELDIGAKYNLRLIEDDEYSRIDNGFIDARLTWKPKDGLEFNAAVWRELLEPTRRSAAVLDQTSYEIGLAAKPLDGWQIEAKGLYERQHEIGANKIFSNYELNATATYDMETNLRPFLKLRQLWESDLDMDDNAKTRSTTSEVQVGFETTF